MISPTDANSASTRSASSAKSSEPSDRSPFGLVISLDFELRWGIRDLPHESDYHRHLLAARRAIPSMLALFREYKIHATWATVGMLLFDSKQELLNALPEVRPTYDQMGLSPYLDLDQIGPNEKTDPLHFGKSLAEEICETPGQELSSHTFCHYYCLEPGQTPEQFHHDIVASVEANERITGTHPRSIVFPRNQCSAEHMTVCRDLGIDVYRGTETHWAYRANAGEGFNSLPKRLTRLADAFVPLTGSQPSAVAIESSGPAESSESVEGNRIWNVPSSRFFRPRVNVPRIGGALEQLRLRRITSAMRSAIEAGQGFHLWWHPHNFGGDVDGNLASLETILKAFDKLRVTHDAHSYTMTEFADASCQ